MSSNTEQSDLALVFADHTQNYYVIPAETFERRRVPAERKAEVEEAMREHTDDVVGHGTAGQVATAAGFLAATTMAGMPGGIIFCAGVLIGATLSDDCFQPKSIPGSGSF